MKPRNQLLIVTTNSFWSTTNFIIAGAFGFIFSIIITRYLGPHKYGQYSYVFSIAAALVLFFELGAAQTVGKYIPKYFSDDKNKYLAVKLYKIVTLIQFIVSSIFVILFYATKNLWIEKLGVSFLPNSIIIIILLYIPLISLVNTLVKFVGATQNYKKIAFAGLIAYVINLILLLLAMYFSLGLDYFIIINTVTNTLVGLILYFYTRPLFHSLGTFEKKINKREVGHFASIAYANLFVQYIVFSYSEIFFLKKYSSIENLGFYILAFTVSTMVTGIFATTQGAVANAQFELLEQGQEDKSDTIAYLTVKYSAIIFLPFVISVSLLMSNLVNIIYGSAYAPVALIFPYLIIARTLNIIFGPIRVKANNHNRIFAKVVGLMALGALINLLADYLLIPKYQLIGAGYANLIAQSITVFLIIFYILRKISFNFNFIKIIKIIVINMGLAFITYIFYRLNYNILYNLLYLFVALTIYIKILKITNIFEKTEYNLALSLPSILPRKAVSILKFIYKIYKCI